MNASESNETHDYRISHRAPGPDDDVSAPLWDVREMMPDYYTRPDIYRFPHGGAERVAERVIMAARGCPGLMVTVYRAVPAGVTTLHTGDWVTLAKGYADDLTYSDTPDAGSHVRCIEVPASQLWTEGYALEWGYSGPDVTMRRA